MLCSEQGLNACTGYTTCSIAQDQTHCTACASHTMPLKRSASRAMITKPSKKAKVPAVLTEASVVLSQDQNMKLLNQDVLPGVDDAAFRDVVQQAISDFKAKDDVDQIVDFAGHRASLCEQAKELKRSLRQDWHDGSDDQIEMKGGIIQEIVDWLNDLFKLAIEKGLELAASQKSLIFMETQMLQIMHDNCRCEYQMCYDAFGGTVTDSSGAKRYSGAPDTIILQFWRDILLMAIMKEDKGVLETFQSHYKRTGKKADRPWGPARNLTNVLPCTPGSKLADKPPEGDWHTDAMKLLCQDCMPCCKAKIHSLSSSPCPSKIFDAL